MIKLKNKDIEIYNLTLLSSEEYKKYRSLIPLLKDDWWWLSDIHLNPIGKRYVDCVDHMGTLSFNNCYYPFGVRPVCNLKILNFIYIAIGDKIYFGDYMWTVLDIDNKEVKMLCDNFVATKRFDPNTNIWEKSELNEWLVTDFLPKLTEKAR